MKRAVVCLAAGESQLPVIRSAKSQGLAVIGVDRNPLAPGLTVSDAALVLSTYEAGPIIEALQGLRQNFALVGVVNRSSGPPVVTAAEIASAFNLPGISPQAARIAVDKGLLMAFCAEHGIVAPDCRTLTSGASLPEVNLPCVVKPALSLVGKSGVRRVEKKTDLAAAVAQAAQCAVNGRVNIEQAVDGRDVSLVGVVISGHFQPLVLLDEINGLDEQGRVRGLAFAVPSRFHGDPVEHAVFFAAQRLIDALGLDTGPCLLSFRITPTGVPHLIEAHLDLGGDRIVDHLLPAASGFDAIGWFVRALTGDFQPAKLTFRPTAVVFATATDLCKSSHFELWSEESCARLVQRLDSLLED
ncbi:MAG: hypothetical protein R2864_03855 [Syntrophotaleaceae bacterium]